MILEPEKEDQMSAHIEWNSGWEANEKRRSRIEILIKYGSAVIHDAITLQMGNSSSPDKAKYVYLSERRGIIAWLRKNLAELNWLQNRTLVHQDNNFAFEWATEV